MSVSVHCKTIDLALDSLGEERCFYIAKGLSRYCVEILHQVRTKGAAGAQSRAGEVLGRSQTLMSQWTMKLAAAYVKEGVHPAQPTMDQRYQKEYGRAKYWKRKFEVQLRKAPRCFDNDPDLMKIKASLQKKLDEVDLFLGRIKTRDYQINDRIGDRVVPTAGVDGRPDGGKGLVGSFNE
jgi:hypothetical protein